ncbi:MAG: nicotinate-nucleotide adenylyltransferase [Pseudomonadota bacterium]
MIGIFGGTFDPIHYGHLRPAQEAMQQLALAELRFIPAAHPPHRPPPLASAAQRLTMVELAIRGLPGLRVDDRELQRGGLSYTVSTLESLRAELGKTPLCLLIGADQFRSFETWHRWQEIPALAHLVVLNRPGATAGVLPNWARARMCADLHLLQEAPAGRLAFLSVSPQDISATRIRAALARGESVQGLLPEAVLDYIRSNQVYGH